jgi:HSP20 family molecular chaperone IbpA
MDEEDTKDLNKILEGLMGKILTGMIQGPNIDGMELTSIDIDPMIETHKIGNETIILLELPGILEEDLVCDIRKKNDVEHDIKGNEDYKILYISTEDSPGARYSVGVKLAKKIKKIKKVSVRNGVVEVILV